MTAALLSLTTRAERILDRIAEVCLWLSAIGILGIALLLAGSSLRRYLFDAPISVTEELGGLLFMATTFLALTAGFLRGRHVRLELLWRALPPRTAAISEFVGLLTALFALGILVDETWKATLFSYELGGRSVMTELLLWPWRLIMPVTLGLMAIAVALRSLRLALGGFTPIADDAPPHGGV